MNKILSILFLSLFLGCGSVSEDVESISQAQNGGQICAGTYNPFSPNYPFPTRGWCKWMPSPAGNYPPPAVDPCDINALPGLHQVKIFSNTALGQCALWPSSTDMDFQHLAFNGWDNIESDGSLRKIKTILIGPHTYFEANNGEYFNGTDNMIFANPYDTNVYMYNFPESFVINSAFNYSYYGGAFVIKLPASP